MNWKVNYWTVLFAAVCIGWLVSSFLFTKEVPEQPTDIPINLSSDRIPNQVAKARIDSFRIYAGAFYFYAQRKRTMPEAPPPVMLEDAIQECKIYNPDVRYFRVPRADLHAMAKASPVDTVYAILSLEKKRTNEGDKQEIDLLFYVGPGSADDEGSFYDFTTPCPTTCDPPPPFDQ